MLSYAHCAKGALSCQLFHETPKALRLQIGKTVSSAPAPCVSSNQIAPEWVTTSFIAAYSLLAIGPVKIADETVHLRHVLNDGDADRFASGLRTPQEYGRRANRENSTSSNADILK